MPNTTKEQWAWRTLGSIRRGRLKAIFAAEDYKGIFDEKFFENVMARLSVLEDRDLKIAALIVTTWAVLAISLLPVHVQINLFGFTSDSLSGLREIILILYSSLGLYLSTVRQQASYLKEMLRAHDENVTPAKGPGSDDARNVLLLAHGISHAWSPPPSEAGLSPMFWTLGINLLRDFFVILFAMAILVGTVAVQWLIMVEIFKHPNYSQEISVLVIAFVIAVDLIMLTGWYMRKGLYPYRDQNPTRVRLFSWGAVRAIWIIFCLVWKTRRKRQKGGPAAS